MASTRFLQQQGQLQHSRQWGPEATTSLVLAFVASSGATSPTAQLSFTLDSGASSCFFCDCTALTPLHTPVTIALADPSVGPVVARSTTTLPCLAPPSGFLTCYYTPSFSRNLVGVTHLHDLGVVSTFPLEEPVAACTSATPRTRRMSTGVVVGPVLAWAEPTSLLGVRGAQPISCSEGAGLEGAKLEGAWLEGAEQEDVVMSVWTASCEAGRQPGRLDGVLGTDLGTWTAPLAPGCQPGRLHGVVGAWTPT
ncbi:unnamed protein product [Closterium sp. NIES-54]